MFKYARHVRNRNVTHPLPRQPDARAQVIGAYIAGLYLSTLAIAFAGGRARAGCAHARRYSPRSIAHRLSVWRSFYRWLALQQPLSCNPVAAVRAPRRAKTLPKALSVDDA